MNRSFCLGQKNNSIWSNQTKPAVFRKVIKKRNGKSLQEAVILKALPVKNPLIVQEQNTHQKGTGKFHKIKLPTKYRDKSQQQAFPMKNEEHSVLGETVKSKTSKTFPQMIPKEQLLSLEQIEQRVEKIINEKLSKIKSFQTYKISEKKEDQIDEELQKVLQSLYFIRNGDNIHDLELDEEIEVINTRISILEKIIAESSTEAEMRKKYFYAKRLQRKLSIKPDNPLYRSLQILKKTSEKKNLRLSNASIYNESVAKSSFKKPNLTCYPVKKKQQVYTPLNPQPATRSSYSREFINFGTLPRFSIKQIDNKIFSVSSLPKKSTYKSEFTIKASKLMNIKEQECCRDKIKNLPFFYERKKNTELATFSKQYYDFVKIQHKRPPQKNYIKNLLSQSKLNYIGKQTSQPIIRNYNLDKLKHNYKLTVHA